jgi:hypothetical protein
MKATIYIISVLVILFTNELSAQKHFQKRKYTKGIFCETIKKLKSDRNKGQQSEIVQVKKVNQLSAEQNVTNDSSITKVSSAIDLIELPLTKLEAEEEKSNTQVVLSKSENLKPSLNLQTLTASVNKKSIVLDKSISSKKLVLKSSTNNAPDESFFSFLFGDFWKNLGIVLLVLAGIALVGGLLLFVLTVNAPWLYISLGVIALGGLVYLIIDNSPKKDTESGEKMLAFLEKVGTPILALLGGIAAAMTRI